MIEYEAGEKAPLKISQLICFNELGQSKTRAQAKGAATPPDFSTEDKPRNSCAGVRTPTCPDKGFSAVRCVRFFSFFVLKSRLALQEGN